MVDTKFNLSGQIKFSNKHLLKAKFLANYLFKFKTLTILKKLVCSVSNGT